MKHEAGKAVERILFAEASSERARVGQDQDQGLWFVGGASRESRILELDSESKTIFNLVLRQSRSLIQRIQMSPCGFILASAALVCAAPEGRDTRPRARTPPGPTTYCGQGYRCRGSGHEMRCHLCRVDGQGRPKFDFRTGSTSPWRWSAWTSARRRNSPNSSARP